jgi:starch synthase
VSGPPTVAVVANVAALEDWVPRDLSLEQWLEGESGGWMFNYVDALARAGASSVVVEHIEAVDRPQLHTHRPTGAQVWAVPPTRHLEAVRQMERHPPPAIRRSDPRSVARGLHAHWRRYRTTSFRAVLSGIRKTNCDAILCQDYESSAFDACVTIGKALRIPAFASFQGVIWSTNAIERWTRRPVLRGSAGLIIGAQLEIDRVKREYGMPDEKIGKIPNPLDTSLWRREDRDEARAALGIPVDARVAVSHGRIDIADKGLDVMFDAWRRIRAERPEADLRLVLLGYGPDADEVQRRIAAGELPGVELHEYVVDQSLLRRQLSAADVFAFCGRFEGFPVAPTEAMASALPVVATAAAGIPDLFPNGEDDGGIVVAMDDTAALADHLGRLLDDPGGALELGKRARRRAEEYLSLDAVGAQLVEFMAARGMRR